MPVLDKTTAGWVRVRLTDNHTTALTEGELVLRADRVRVATDGENLEFLLADDVVFRLDRRYFKALAWFVDRPTFGEWLKARRAQHPNSHRPWSEDERRRLDTEIGLYGMGWQQIAQAHGRTVSAVRRRAALDGIERN